MKFISLIQLFIYFFSNPYFLVESQNEQFIFNSLPFLPQIVPIIQAPLVTFIPSAPLASSGTVALPTVSPIYCRSTTGRSHLDCPCSLIGKSCQPKFSLCIRDPNGDGFCSCNSAYMAYNGSCITIAEYNGDVLKRLKYQFALNGKFYYIIFFLKEVCLDYRTHE